jgi:hypothetical protein
MEGINMFPFLLIKANLPPQFNEKITEEACFKVRSEILMAVKMLILVFWVVIPCGLP